LALPLGNYPADVDLAAKGSFQGNAYQNEAILMVAGGPALSPFSLRCNLHRLPRIQVTGNEFKYWLNYFELHPEESFVSDGKADTVTFPRHLQSQFNSSKFKNLTANPY
jgi:hypothetical protein